MLGRKWRDLSFFWLLQEEEEEEEEDMVVCSLEIYSSIKVP